MRGSPARRVKLWAFRLLLGVSVFGLLEGASQLAIAVVSPIVDERVRTVASIYEGQSRLISQLLDTTAARRQELDPYLGWRYRPGHSHRLNHINDAGLRGLRDYDTQRPRGRLRVAAFGDSFVYGTEVSDSATWPAQIEALDDRVDVLNYGMGGYGTDQSYLRYLREGATFNPHIVVIGFVPINLRRVVMVYPRFVSSSDGVRVKPRFVLNDNGGLTLLSDHLLERQDYERLLQHPETIRNLGRYDQWYEPLMYENRWHDRLATVRLAIAVWIRSKRRYWARDRLIENAAFNTDSEAFRTQVAVMARFVKAIEANHARPLVVFFPDRPSVARAISGAAPVYVPLKRELDNRGVPTLDLAPRFARRAGDTQLDSWFMPGGHYSPMGNRIVAEELLGTLRAWTAGARW